MATSWQVLPDSSCSLSGQFTAPGVPLPLGLQALDLAVLGAVAQTSGQFHSLHL